MIVTKQIKKYLKENYISKKKIREKIDELYKADKDWTEDLGDPLTSFKVADRNLKAIKNKIDILKEILREEENE